MKLAHARSEISNFVATVTLDHQEVMNAVSSAMLKDLSQIFDDIREKKADIRCVVMTGAGKGFCTGANLQGRDEKSGEHALQRGAGATLESEFHPFLRRLRDLHCPLVTAINGPAAGAGMSLALMGDIVVMARSAYFLQAFRRIGLVPDCGSSWLLPRLVGRARALELSLLGERLPADKALEWGLINRVVDDAALQSDARKLAEELAHGPTFALSLIRKLYWESPDNTYEQQLDLERQFQQRAGEAEDFKEGVSAFLDKRPAKFTGR